METHLGQPTTDERIDIHNSLHALNRDLARLAQDQTLRPEHRRVLLQFISDCRAGRTVEKRARKRLSPGRCLKLLYMLRRCARELTVPFEDATATDIEHLVLGLEDGLIGQLSPSGAHLCYKPSSVLDIKKCLRKFYRWLYPNNEPLVKELTGWFDTRDVAPELKTFGLGDVERMARAAGSVQGQALITTLFDGGFRAGEWRNLRLYDLTVRPDAQGVPTCFTRIRESKTKPRTISLPLATESLLFWVARHPNGGPVGPDGRIQAKDPSAPIFTWSYHYCRKVLYQIGRQELGERLYFHRFRHASATFYAKHLGHYALTARFGWTMGSRAIQRYIDHSGILAEDTASVIRREVLETPGYATAHPACPAPARLVPDTGGGGRRTASTTRVSRVFNGAPNQTAGPHIQGTKVDRIR